VCVCVCVCVAATVPQRGISHRVPGDGRRHAVHPVLDERRRGQGQRQLVGGERALQDVPHGRRGAPARRTEGLDQRPLRHRGVHHQPLVVLRRRQALVVVVARPYRVGCVSVFVTARGELRKILFLALSVTLVTVVSDSNISVTAERICAEFMEDVPGPALDGICAPSTTLLGYIFATKARIDNRKKTC